METKKDNRSEEVPGISPVGEGARRVDAKDKVTGDAKFAADISPPGVLTTVVVRSTVTRGSIRDWNLQNVREMDGVEAVLTADEILGENVVPVIEDDQPVLAESEVRYDGEPVALIAVRGRRRADEIRELVRVEYVEEDPVLDPQESLQEDSPDVAQPEFSEGHNLFTKLEIDKGDVEKAIEDSPIVVEGEYRTGYQEHAYMEPQGVVALPAPHGGIEIRGTMQCPYYVRNAVSRVLGRPLNRIKVVQVATGGAFGGKEDVPSQLAAYAALLSDATNEPVKLIYDRREDIRVTSKRHPSVVRYESAADRDG
ncbi:molybdopterin-dependent oxidoreductase, partial [Candidatus Bipolaricaulota bacterium]|nr:molybdopterin-dependent oxidoreductase [Candidatus Bipolaricaulota bacterium]